MSENKNARELFGDALAEAMLNKYDAEIVATSESADCTEEHQKRMTALVESRRIRKKSFSKRIISGILAASILLFSGITVYAYGGSIGGFFERVYNGFVEITYGDSEINTLDRIYESYELSYVPAGYEQIFGLDNAMVNKKEWRNETGEHVIFTQTVLDSVFTFEDGERESFEYRGREIFFCRCDSCYVYIWNDGKYFMSIDSSVDLGTNELFTMIDGIRGTGL